MKKSFFILSLLLSSSAFADSSTAHPPTTEPSSAIPSMPDTRPQVSPGASASAAPTATPLITPAAQITDAEKKKITAEFQKALYNQRSALTHQEKSSIKELSNSQSMKRKRWLEDEKNARHQYFDQHMSGPERREYVQNFAKKKHDFEVSLKSEYAAAKKAWADKAAALKNVQKDQEAKFKTSLTQGVRPGPELWPASN